MPQFMSSEPAEAVLATLAEAIDRIDVGVVLLDRDLRVQFVNQRFADMCSGLLNALARNASLRTLLEHAAGTIALNVPPDSVPAWLEEREAAVRAQAASTAEIDSRDGRCLLFRSIPCADGGRVLTCDDVTTTKRERNLLAELRETMERMAAEQRFTTETLEDQAANLVALAEAADENAHKASEANRRLQEEIAERRQLEAELRRLATTDALTGVLNRAQFLSLAQNAFERASRLNRPVTVLMLDIDHFKKINDRYGHFMGDEVLKHFVAQLRIGVRGSDLLGRLGGEEFAIVLPETDCQAGLDVGERLRARVAASSLVQGEHAISITVSIGVATAGDDDRAMKEVLARADAMLYAAKANGRDQVCAEVTMPEQALL